MHDDTVRVEARIKRVIAELVVPALYSRAVPLAVSAWVVPGEPVPFAHAVAQKYVSFPLGGEWGRPWGTVWFHLTGTVPADWADGSIEIVVDLGFSGGQSGFQAEGLAFTPAGTIIKAVEPHNRYVPVRVGPGGAVDVYLEAAANPNLIGDFTAFEFSPSTLGNPDTAGQDALYRLRQVDLAERDVLVWELLQDLRVLDGLRGELPIDSPRRAEILRALEHACDVLDPDDVAGSASAARDTLAEVLASPAHASAHRIYAVGHAHIDSAWLWPLRETVRKCARTFSNVLALLETQPEMRFVASSAQQYAWIKESYPQLFERIVEQVRAGRFVPVGGMWVESDTNMPGSEALVRQFVEGKAFFLEEFGIETLDVWLPDTFGYSAALPQVIRGVGSRWFLTQKISWNDTNTMPHHTFLWEGLDGSRVFTHFPPADTYNGDLSAAELARAERQFREKGRANTSLVPFGWGDGGGGPTREMLAAAKRTADLEGSPRVVLSNVAEFFEAAASEYPDPPVWTGEMYLEFHRGTYTSQVRTKQGNRRSEHLLREAELWAATATVRHGKTYPDEQLRELWRTVLLCQFHDILPGSSISWVHREAEKEYARVARELEQIIADSLRVLVGDGDTVLSINSGPFERDGIPALGGAVRTPATGVHLERHGTDLVFVNDRVRVTIDARGLITSAFDLRADREVVPAGGAANLLQLHRDTPNQWDAWDIDEHYRHTVRDLTDVESVTVIEESAERVAVRVSRVFGRSAVRQELSLTGGSSSVDIRTEVDWDERRKLLKLAFPIDVHTDHAASEIQFGHILRPTHTNTSWDAARFETCAHRWVQVGEPGFGVAVANDSTYGHDVTRHAKASGGSTSTVRQTLLRSSIYPDPAADSGTHVFRSSLRVGAGIAEAIDEGYRLNLPLRTIAGGGPIEPLVEVLGTGLIIETVKLARDGSGDVVMRVYEGLGNVAKGRLRTSFDRGRAFETDLLEREVGAPTGAVVVAGDDVRLHLRPFQVLTIRLPRAG